MRAIRVRNLRSFSNSPQEPYVDLKPVTVFIGKNSCGKSSLLRTLPLLRQSYEASTNGPILWYGPLTDFGMFSNAINKNTEEDTIYFDFKIDDKKNNVEDVSFEIELGVSQKIKQTIYKSLKILVEGIDIELSFEKGNKIKCQINGEDINCNHLNHRTNFNQFLPRLVFNRSEYQEPLFELRQVFDLESFDKLNSILQNSHLNDSSLSDLQHRWMRRGFIDKETFSSLLSNKSTGQSDFFIGDEVLFDKSKLDEIYLLYVKSFLVPIIRYVDSLLSSSVRNVKYIAPLRASSERFYRFQDYSVSELDPEGKNLVMLLLSLSQDEMDSFKAWTQDNFDFEVILKEEGMHYQIMIDNEGDITNIHDMGFGFSQILPIVASLWYESSVRNVYVGRYRQLEKIIAIEQPELHLHPELQAKLAKVIAKLVYKLWQGKFPLKVVFETHSKTMINALGDLVEENPDYRNMINIVVFDKKENTKIQSISFDEDGDLIDWPIGFFSGR